MTDFLKVFQKKIREHFQVPKNRTSSAHFPFVRMHFFLKMVTQQEKCLKIILFCIFGLHTYMYNIEFDDDDSDDGLLELPKQGNL